MAGLRHEETATYHILKHLRGRRLTIRELATLSNMTVKRITESIGRLKRAGRAEVVGVIPTKVGADLKVYQLTRKSNND